MNKLYLIIIFLCCTLMAMGQGQIKRPHKTVKPKVEISQPDGYINGHGYVDLGLPSGVRWATYNVGATSPEENGNYYAWGETDTKPTYTRANSRHAQHTLVEDLKAGKGSYDTLKAKWAQKLKSDGVIDSRGNLTASYDVASTNWGASWRLPTKEEFEELLSYCSFQRISFKGEMGFKVIGPNGKSIFFGTEYGYWISTIFKNTNWKANIFIHMGKIVTSITDLGPQDGHFVRPVSE